MAMRHLEAAEFTLSRKQTADILGISRRALRNYVEAGHRKISPTEVLPLAARLQDDESLQHSFNEIGYKVIEHCSMIDPRSQPAAGQHVQDFFDELPGLSKPEMIAREASLKDYAQWMLPPIQAASVLKQLDQGA